MGSALSCASADNTIAPRPHASKATTSDKDPDQQAASSDTAVSVRDDEGGRGGRSPHPRSPVSGWDSNQPAVPPEPTPIVPIATHTPSARRPPPIEIHNTVPRAHPATDRHEPHLSDVLHAAGPPSWSSSSSESVVGRAPAPMSDAAVQTEGVDPLSHGGPVSRGGGRSSGGGMQGGMPVPEMPTEWLKGESIGSGSFGTVYLGLNCDTGKAGTHTFAAHTCMHACMHTCTSAHIYRHMHTSTLILHTCEPLCRNLAGGSNIHPQILKSSKTLNLKT